ncbi:hypothetical protein RI054_21g92630 [Pseudoscourfieldia marina]
MGGGDYHSLVAKGALRLVRTRYVGVCRRFPRCIDCGIAERCSEHSQGVYKSVHSAAYAMHGEGPMELDVAARCWDVDILFWVEWVLVLCPPRPRATSGCVPSALERFVASNSISFAANTPSASSL